MRILTNLVRTRKIPHAMLFTGIDGVGRYRTAIRFAMALNCAEQPKIPIDSGGQRTFEDIEATAHWPVCGTCQACKKIHAGGHPDILHIQPAGNAIKIAHIRSLRDTLALKPYEARYRFAILEKAQVMTLPAANALLKMLEEPPTWTTLILIANKSSDLLPTITSRCQHVRFPPLPEKQIARSIAASESIGKEEAQIVAAMASGSYRTAQEAASVQWLRQRNWLINELMRMHTGAASVKNGVIRRILAVADILAHDPQQLFNLLGIIKSWLRDSAVLPLAPERMINRDKVDQMKKMTSSVPPRMFINGFEALEKTEKQIQANANPRLALETYLIKLAQDISTPGGLESFRDYGENRRHPV